MRSQIYNYINTTISIMLFAVAGLTPLLFLNVTTDFFNMPKLIFLLIMTIIMLGLWIVSWIVQGKIVITRTPLDVPLLILLFVILASTFFSTSRNASIYGIFPEVHASAVSWITYIILYFVAASHLKKVGQIKVLLYVFYTSASFLAMISILSFFQIYLPFDMARGINFTPTGSTFSTIALLLMLLPLPFISMVNRNKLMPQLPAVILSVLFSFTVVLIGSITTHLLLLAVFVVCIFVARSHLTLTNLPVLSVPIVISVLMLMVVYLPFSGNKIFEIRNNFPQEIQLPLVISWKISATAFRDAPFVGTGPATFLYNFTAYKPVEFNQLRFWNFSFGSAYNEYLQVLGTLGMTGLITLTAISAVIIIYSVKHLFFKNNEEIHDDTRVLLPALAVTGLLAVVLLFVHATTLVSVVATFLLMAAFMMSHKHIREKVSEFSIGVKVSTSDNRQLDFLPIFVLILFLVAAVPVSGRTYNAVAADYYHRLALTEASRDGLKTYDYLQKAEALNPFIDLYRIDMAQTNFALANALAAQKGPTTENPEGTLTDQEKESIQTLITQAINEGRASVVLNPRSSRNWEVLALLYRNITGVANNSLAFSLDAYGRAIELDPLNPALRVNVGSIYLITQNYDFAIRFFTDAINLKPDYINGYYNLAVALRDKGDLENARLVAEQVVNLLQQDLHGQDYKAASDELKEIKIQDYNTAFELLNEIKVKIDAGDEGETDTALQNPNLPSIDVPDMDNPPEATTPPAVEDNPEADLPELNLSVTPIPAQ